MSMRRFPIFFQIDSGSEVDKVEDRIVIAITSVMYAILFQEQR